MKLKFMLVISLVAPLVLTACAKKEEAAATDQGQNAPAAEEKITPEQQAAIDAIDKPVMDENNTDISPEQANAPAEDSMTPAAETPAPDAETATTGTATQ